MTPQQHLIAFMNRLYRGPHVYLLGDLAAFHVVDHTGVTMLQRSGTGGYNECRQAARTYADRNGLTVFDMTDMRDCSICRGVHGPEIQHACE